MKKITINYDPEMGEVIVETKELSDGHCMDPELDPCVSLDNGVFVVHTADKGWKVRCGESLIVEAPCAYRNRIRLETNFCGYVVGTYQEVK